MNNCVESYQIESDHLYSQKVIVITAGLPLRGKSLVAKKLYQFFSWLGFKIKIFNIGEYVKNKEGIKDYDFVAYDLSEELREKSAFSVLNNLLDFVTDEGGNMAIYDGTNVTQKRRDKVLAEIEKRMKGIDYEIVWIESISDNPYILDVSKSRYTELDFEKSKIIIDTYRKKYVPFNDESQSYIKIFNFTKIMCSKIKGYIQAKMLYYLVNLNTAQKPLFFTRHGESKYNVLDKIGGDSSLSRKGREYAHSICKLMEKQPEYSNNLKIFCSTLKRSIETVSLSGLNQPNRPIIKWRALAEIESGEHDGMSYKEIKQKFPAEYISRSNDKLNYRYPKGESYRDLKLRIEPVLLELERSDAPVLVVGHRAVLRCLYGYFCCLPEKEIPHIEMPLHTVIKLERYAFGCRETRFTYESGNEAEFRVNVIEHLN